VSLGGGRAATALLLECPIGVAAPLLARNPSREPPQSRDLTAAVGIDEGGAGCSLVRDTLSS